MKHVLAEAVDFKGNVLMLTDVAELESEILPATTAIKDEQLFLQDPEQPQFLDL